METVQKQHKFLEKIDVERWTLNAIITGVQESDPNDDTTAMLYQGRVAATDTAKAGLIMHAIRLVR